MRWKFPLVGRKKPAINPSVEENHDVPPAANKKDGEEQDHLKGTNEVTNTSSNPKEQQQNDDFPPGDDGGNKKQKDDDDDEKASSSSTTTKKAEGKDGGDSDNDDEDSKKVAPISKLLGLARPEMGMLIVAMVLMVAAEATGMLNPLLVANAYDDLVDVDLTSRQRMNQINSTMWLVLVIHFAGVLLSFFRATIMHIAGERVVSRTRNRLYRNLLRQEIAFFDTTQTGELVSRLGSDTALLQQGTSQALPEVIIGGIKIIVSVGIMFWISAKLAGLIVGFVFIIFVVCIPFGKLLGQLSKQYQDVLGLAQTFSTEALAAMRTVQSFAAEDREHARYQNIIGQPDFYKFWWPSDFRTHKTTYSVGYFKSTAMVGLFTIIFGIGFGSMYISLWYGFKLVTDGEMTLGQLTAFQSYIFTIGGSLGHSSQFISKLIEAQGAASRIFVLLERIPSIPTTALTEEEDSSRDKETDSDDESPSPPRQLQNLQGAVAFNNVHFSYPARPNVEVLAQFSLSIPANQTCALVGQSGSGKTTAVNLLQRFYDVTAGSITIDGVDIRNLDLRWLRSQIGYVQQEPQLFGLTVRENITYGLDQDVTQEEIEEVARKANAHNFIVGWPDGYDTLVGERGVRASGGQRQRIAIARALLCNPKIMLLDEATSALDAESEHLVQEAIDKAVVGRTVLIVAHRLSTIQRAEQIVVVDDHHIADVGTHNVLMDRCSKYQDLIKRQSLIGRLPDSVLSALKD